MAWQFRRRFIDFHRSRMEDLAQSQHSMHQTGRKDQFAIELADGVRAIRIDLKALEADAQVRGIDRTNAIRRGLAPEDRSKFDEFMSVHWPPLYRQLEERLRDDVPDPQQLCAILTQMDPINRWFCHTAIKRLHEATERNCAPSP